MASNPILSSDIYKDQGDIKDAIAQLEQLHETYKTVISSLKKEAKGLEISLDKTTIATAEGREETEKLAKSSTELERRLNKYKATATETGEQIAVVKLQQQRLNRQQKLSAKQVVALGGSYDDLSSTLSLAKIRWKQLSKEQRDNSKEGRDLTNQINSINEELKELDSTVGVHSRNVGNYQEAIEAATGASGDFNQTLNLIRANPVFGVLALLLGIIGALGKAFLGSEKGASAMNKASAIMAALWSNLVEISVALVDNLMAVFDDPMGALKSFGEALKNNIVNRFKAIIDIGGAVGQMFKALWERDLEGIKEAAMNAGGALTQMVTGIKSEDIKDFANSVKDLTKEINKEAEAFVKLFEAQRSVRRSNRSLSREVAELAKQQAILTQISSDATLSFDEQKAAALELEKVLLQKGQTELRIAKNNLSIINQEIKLRRANGEEIEDLLDSQLSAFEAVKQAETELLGSQLDNAQKRREISRDEFERELDFAIDVFDAEKMKNERIIQSDQLTFSKRVALLNETKKLNESSFASQLQLVEDFTGKKLDLDQLSKESDERLIRERLRGHGLDDILLGRILEIIRERKAATQDMIDLEQTLFKIRSKNAGIDDLELLPDVTFGEHDALENIKKRATFALLEARSEIADELAKKEEKDIFDLLGFNLSDDKKEGILSSLDFAKNQFVAFAQERLNISNQLVQASNNEVQQAQQALDNEIALEAEGLTNRRTQAQQELEEAKKRQSDALKEQRRAQRQQNAIQTIQQASNIFTASTKVWSQLGFPAAIPALGIMWGSFIGAKVRAAQLSKRKFGKGTFMSLDWGGSHASGNDIELGPTKDGRKMMTAEKGESFAVFSKSAMGKYKSMLPYIVNALNNGEFEAKVLDMHGSTDAGNPILFQSNEVDMGTTNRHLSQIQRQGENRIFTDANGNIIELYKNVKRVYVS